MPVLLSPTAECPDCHATTVAECHCTTAEFEELERRPEMARQDYDLILAATVIVGWYFGLSLMLGWLS